MDEISTIIIPTIHNTSSPNQPPMSHPPPPSPPPPLQHSDWWPDDSTTDQQQLQLRLFTDLLDPSDSGGNLWSGGFVPPPPRPAFLDENIATDGVTTCDMCSWAWQDGGGGGGGKYSGRGGANGYGMDGELISMEAHGELSWVFTLVIVSLISAVIGAIVMIIVLHCKSRIKTSGLNESEHNTTTSTNLPLSRMQRPPMDLPPADNKPITRPNSYVHHHLHHHRHEPQLHMTRSTYGLAPPHSFDMIAGGLDSPVDHSHLHHHNHHSGVWQWLTRRCSSGSIGGVCGNHLLDGRGISPTAAENHYTHMDETYNIQNSGGLPASNLSIITTTTSQHDQSSGEALYAELDSTNGDLPNANTCKQQPQSQLLPGSPHHTPPPPPPPPPPPFICAGAPTNISSYQNTGYTEHPDHGGSSNTPPSSAYYSDLSVNGTTDRSGGSSGERAYEVVGVGANAWHESGGGVDKRAGSLRLASISEAIGASSSVPSDYV